MKLNIIPLNLFCSEDVVDDLLISALSGVVGLLLFVFVTGVESPVFIDFPNLALCSSSRKSSIIYLANVVQFFIVTTFLAFIYSFN